MAGGVRYDLKDHPCGKVTQEHLANAGKRLDEIKKKQQERRKRACLGFCVNAFSQK
ncbi:ProQ/FINO family protein [Escherichia coli]|nr:ProQ/FINO family protein [Escherichia coli]MDF8694101.1 ProQ/FINO family protein [Escherichia coli]MDF8712450.1 ProQ/FINO family protein [Escherichia coli]MDF8755660.1 ProQ/FINO family protein [Escherichia coli]